MQCKNYERGRAESQPVNQKCQCTAELAAALDGMRHVAGQVFEVLLFIAKNTMADLSQ